MKKLITEEKLTKIFCIFSGVLFTVLFYFSMIKSWVNDWDLKSEYVSPQPDNVMGNLLWLGIILGTILLLYHFTSRCKYKYNMDIVAAIVSVLALAFSIYWIPAAATAPQGDQIIVCECAEAFEYGNLEALEKGQYVSIYPQQLGIITFLRILFKIFGMGNYQAYQYLNALMVPILIFTGYQIVKRMSAGSRFASGCYLFLMMTCLPIYCYVPYVYGEIVSSALVMFAGWMLLWIWERFSPVKVGLLGVALGVAVQFRKNVLIFVIAFAIAIIVRMLREFSRQGLYTLASMLVGVALFQGLITGMYSRYIPEDSVAVPTSVFVAMGLNSDNGMAGWHNYFDQLALAENDYDISKAKQAASDVINDFIQKSMDDPAYAVDFFGRKIGSQWNAPMYQGLAMNNKIDGEQSPLAASIYFGELRNFFEGEMNLHQLLVYGAVMCLLWLTVKKWKRIDNYLLLIGVFGGFLFTVIWEAKTRYVFPYYLMLIPYAAVGLYQLVSWIERHFCKDKIDA